MPFTIPDKGEGANDVQSILFQEYLDVVIAGLSGSTCVKTGCAVTAQGVPNMTVAVAAGTVRSNDKDFTVAADNGTITAADAANPRLDLVVITSAGAIAVRAGTPALNPKPAARTANDVVLAVVYVPAADTTIEGTQITDLRVVNNNITPGIGGALSGMRNKIINGDMRINQRAAASLVGSGYLVDRWRSEGVAQGSIYVDPGTLSLVGTKHLTMQCNTVLTPAVGDYYMGRHSIEGFNIADLQWGTANAKSVTITFRAVASVAGVYSLAVRNGGGTRSYVVPVSIGTAAASYSVTIPGDTAGTWAVDNTAGMHVSLCFAANTAGTYTTSTLNAWIAGEFFVANTQSNGLATLNRSLSFTDVQLEQGTIATPFEVRSYGAELNLCQRYYEKQILSMRWDASAINSILTNTLFYVEKRAVPTCTVGTPRVSQLVSSLLAQAADLNIQSTRIDLMSSGAGDCYALGTPVILSAEL